MRPLLILTSLWVPAAVLIRSLLAIVRYASAVLGEARVLLVTSIGLALTLVVLASGAEMAASRRGHVRGPCVTPLARLFCLGVVGWLLIVISQGKRYEPWRVDLGLALVLAPHAALVLVDPILARLPGRLRRSVLRVAPGRQAVAARRSAASRPMDASSHVKSGSVRPK